MDLLGDFLLFGLGPEQGPLLFGGSSITQSPGGGSGHSNQRSYSRPRPAPVPEYHAPGILTSEEIAADDDLVAELLITMITQVPYAFT